MLVLESSHYKPNLELIIIGLIIVISRAVTIVDVIQIMEIPGGSDTYYI